MGVPERPTNDYRRHGVIALFATLNVASGNLITPLLSSPSPSRVLTVLRNVEAEVPTIVRLVFESHFTLDRALRYS